MSPRPLILLTGASGYIGGRLLPILEERGEKLRCLARHPVFIKPRVGPGTEVIDGDLLELPTLHRALSGVHTAFYLAHSMSSSGDFREMDRLAAENFGTAAKMAGVKRIIYLGGLANGGKLSPHLASRHEVGNILAASGVPVIELRASIIIGSGSLSFEMVRGLVERLPVMFTPRWVRNCAQPISVEDILEYLLESITLPEGSEGVYEIGGADKVSYDGIMREYARQRRMHRLIIPVPLLSLSLSSHWLAIITPIYAKVGRKLVEGVRNASCVENPSALSVFKVRPRGLSEAIARAIAKEDQEFTATHWSDALSETTEDHHWWGLPVGTRRVDSYSRVLCYPPDEVFAPIQCVGGQNGWFAFNWMWKLRGAMDRFTGGVGLRRGRRDPSDLRQGDAIDFWRVEKYAKDRLLLLFAEMKLPGRAWLYFEVGPHAEGSEVRMTAVFDPIGVWGRLYWYAVYPFHFLVFNGMFRGLVKTIEKNRRECAL